MRFFKQLIFLNGRWILFLFITISFFTPAAFSDDKSSVHLKREPLFKINNGAALNPSASARPTVMSAYEKGVKFYAAEEYSRSAVAFEQSLKDDPEAKDIYAKLGFAYFMDGQFQAALKNFLLAYNLTPKDPQLLLYLGKSYLALDQMEKAFDFTLRALQIDPELSQGYADLIDTLLRKGRISEATGLVQQAVKRDPTDPFLRISLAQLLRMDRKIDEAEKEFLLARQLLVQAGHPEGVRQVDQLLTELAVPLPEENVVSEEFDPPEEEEPVEEKSPLQVGLYLLFAGFLVFIYVYLFNLTNRVELGLPQAGIFAMVFAALAFLIVRILKFIFNY